MIEEPSDLRRVATLWNINVGKQQQSETGIFVVSKL